MTGDCRTGTEAGLLIRAHSLHITLLNLGSDPIFEKVILQNLPVYFSPRLPRFVTLLVIT